MVCGIITCYNICSFPPYAPDSCCSISPQKAGWWLVSVLGSRNLCFCLLLLSHKLWGYTYTGSWTATYRFSCRSNKIEETTTLRRDVVCFYPRINHRLRPLDLLDNPSWEVQNFIFTLCPVWCPSDAPCVLHYHKPPAWKITFDTDNVLRCYDAEKYKIHWYLVYLDTNNPLYVEPGYKYSY